MLPDSPLTAETKYQLLMEISRKLRDTFDLDETLNHLLDTLQTILEYNAAGIFILSRDIADQLDQYPRTMIAGIARRGFDPHPDDADRMLTLGEGITGHVIRTGLPVIIPDVRQDPRYIAGRAKTRSEIAIPILLNERVIGALNVESDSFSAFNENDLDVLRFFADAAAISIEKAMLHRKLIEKEHMDEQLKTAGQVQTRLTPEQPPSIPGYEIAGICLPAYDIGGDYFDYIPLEDGRLGIALADVSGHGVPAALVMSAFRALLRTQARLQSDPAPAMQFLNRTLPDFTGRDDYVTVIYGTLDPPSGEFTYSNCGHPPALLFRSAGEIGQLRRGGPALSVFSDRVYEKGRETLSPGDMLMLYTDGVTENIAPGGEFFELEDLAGLVQQNYELPVQEILPLVVSTVKSFTGADVFQDDFTLMLLRRTAS